MREIRGELDATGLEIGVVTARWNQSITDRMLDAALSRLAELGANDPLVVRVPGALEIPVTAMELASGGCDGVIAIGVIIKGDTDHYEIVVRESTAGVSEVSLRTGVPVGNAILAVHDIDDAIARSEPGKANKGVEAVDAVVETATLLRAMRERD